MKRSLESREMTPLNGAAFRVGAEALRRGGLALLLEETLAQVFGGLGTGSMESAVCTEFTCNVYAPPPPPPN
jgi:hypothetical protein